MTITNMGAAAAAPGDQRYARRCVLAMLAPDPPAAFELRVFEHHDRVVKLWPSDLADAERLIELHALRGHEVFHGVQPRAKVRTKELAAGHVVWCDLDTTRAVTKLELSDLPAATAVVLSGSSDGETAKRHAYWSVWEALDPATVHALNLRLAAALDGDTKSAEPAHILRTPGSKNRKPDGRVCRVLDFTGETYALADLEGALPALEPDLEARLEHAKAAMPTDEAARLFATDVIAEADRDHRPELPHGRHDRYVSVCGYLLRHVDTLPVAVVRELAVCWALARMKPPKERAELVRHFDSILKRELDRLAGGGRS